MTPHNEANKKEIAKTVLMPGDPLRAKMIAEKYLTDYKLVNDIRNDYAYTGYYKGKRLTVMASGMGIPSIGIYSYELYNNYGVENIIRVGTAGAYTDQLNLYDNVIVTESYSESDYAKEMGHDNSKIMNANEEIVNILEESARRLNKKYTKGRICTSDVFYGEKNIQEIYEKHKCIAVEMETFGLFYNAKKLNKKAGCILTISDNLITKEETTAEERQNAFHDMIEIALDAAIKL